MIPDQTDYQQAPPPEYIPRPSSPSGLSIAAFVLGIVSLIGCGPCLGIPALITGLIELGRIKSYTSAQEGRPFALAGAIMGGISTGLAVLAILFYIVFFGIMISTGAFDTAFQP